MVDHSLKEIERDEDGKVVAVCHCEWKSLPTTRPQRSIDDHQRRMMGF